MSLLGIGINGLNISQASLQVTGNNIANANIPSYSRQRVELATLPEQLGAGGYMGSGSIVEDISRVVDQFLITQIQLDTASYNRLNTFAANIGQVDSLLADELSGLGPAISNFFSAIESSAQDPTSEPARQVVISEAQGLAQRINDLTSRMMQQAAAVNSQLASLTAQASTLAQGIAELNQAIEDQTGRGAGAQPNQLLDQRDELLRQLAEIVTVTTVTDGGALNVFVGNGQPLVIGSTASTISTMPSTSEPGNIEVAFIGGNGIAQQITSFISGGKMGGILEFRDEVASDVLNSLGRIALGLADSLNQQNALGIDLDGNIGGDIFQDINAGSMPAQRVVIDSANSAPGLQSIEVNISDVGQLTTSDYLVYVIDNDGSAPLDYQIVRSSDNSSIIINGVAGAQSINIDGFNIDIPATTQSNLAINDRFYIRPTRTAGADMRVEINRVQELAYAAPIVTDARVGNTGNGLISGGQVLEIIDDAGTSFSPSNPLYASAGVLAAPVLIRFTSATDFSVYEFSDSSAPELLFSDTIIPGQRNDIFGNSIADPNYIGFQAEISGIPQAGDEFVIQYNMDGSSDNRNAVALGEVRARDILAGGSTNFENAYGSLIEEIGTRAAQSNVGREAAQSLLFQSQNNRDSISGVNLDEEAANLIKFEQSYSASAQIISIARQLFDTLLGILR